MNRNTVREALERLGITCNTVSNEELKRLRQIVSLHLRQSNIYKGSARLARAKKDLRFIEMKTSQWACREAISFNQDGFIGIAGWADDRNVQPLLSALLDWSKNAPKKRGLLAAPSIQQPSN